MAWHPAGPLTRFPEGEALAIRVDGREVVVARDRDDVLRAAVDMCPHLGLSLGGGLVRRGRLACPHHSYVYDLATGERLRAPGPGVPSTFQDDVDLLELLAVRVTDGQVEIEL